MTVLTVEMKKELFSSPVETTKDKVLSFRIEEGLYKLLEDISKELDTDTVSNTARKILRFYLLNAIYEEEWKRFHSKDFSKLIQKVDQAGKTIELENFKNLVAELSEYAKLMRAIIDRINISSEFFEGEMSKLEETTSKLEGANILLRKASSEGVKKPK